MLDTIHPDSSRRRARAENIFVRGPKLQAGQGLGYWPQQRAAAPETRPESLYAIQLAELDRRLEAARMDGGSIDAAGADAADRQARRFSPEAIEALVRFSTAFSIAAMAAVAAVAIIALARAA